MAAIAKIEGMNSASSSHSFPFWGHFIIFPLDLAPLPEDIFEISSNTIDNRDNGGDKMGHHEENKEKKEENEAKVEPIKPGDKRGGKKKGLLDTCQ